MQTRSMKLFATIVLASCLLVVRAPQAQAKAKQLNFEVLVDHQAEYRDVLDAAKTSAQGKISQQFRENPEVSTLQISVLLDRNGEIIPLFTTAVSRAQWQQQPRIEPWVKYHNSYALLKRHEYSEGPDAIVASASASTSLSRPTVSPSYGHDLAFDRGGLPSRFVQKSLDYWD